MDMKYEVRTERESREINGYDSTILPMPQEFYVNIGDDDQPAFAAIQFARFLRRLSDDMALGVGEALHHAIYVVTTDPEIVSVLGVMHEGCQDCMDGTAKAVTMMKEEPGLEMLVGQLWWTDP